MRISSLPLVTVLTAGSQQVAVAQQTLADAQFQVRYSALGVTSVTHVHDKYDTEYISAGEALGDLLIRYRAQAEKNWKQASAATLEKSSEPDELTANYIIGVQVPTITTSSETSSSVRFPGMFALNDRRVPKSSHDTETSLFLWPGRKGTREWVQYDFPAPKKVWSAEVYWAQDDYLVHQWKLPKSWRVFYRDGDDWREVAKGNYSLLADQDSKVVFEPVTTSALRVEAQLDDKATARIFEWRVNGAQAGPGHHGSASQRKVSTLFSEMVHTRALFWSKSASRCIQTALPSPSHAKTPRLPLHWRRNEQAT